VALHVDVIKNEWAAGIQYPVAAVHVSKGEVQVEAGDPEGWRETVLRTVSDVSPKRVRDFLDALHTRLNGSYLFTTEPHDDRACPYRESPVAYIQPAGGASPARRPTASAR